MTKNNVFIKCDDVSVTYEGKQGSTEALSSIQLEIYEGDFLVLLGPSGCGKSTLLNLIAGYTSPTSGCCPLEGKRIEGPDRERGVVFQSANLYPWLSVRENVEYGLKISGVTQQDRKEKALAYLNHVGLAAYADHYPFELSGGMKQRVALIRALINEPRLLLMDEPFGALDAMTRYSMQSFLRTLWKEGTQTFFLITHDIEEALSLGNRVCVMSKNPGTILKTYDVSFAEKLNQDPEYSTSVDPEFMALKDEILNLIK